MATVKSNRQSYYPPISPNPTAQELALHLKNVYTAMNNHDAAIDLLNGKVTSNTSSISEMGTTTIVTKTIVISQFPGLGGVNDQTSQTAYTATSTDNGILLLLGDSSAVTLTLNSAMTVPYFLFVTNYGSSTVTLAPTSGVVNQLTIPVGGLYLIVFDGTNWKATAILSLPTFVDAVTPTPATDGTTTVFTLPSAPSPALSLMLNLGGLTQYQGVGLDYTLSGVTVTYTTAPAAGLNHVAWYRK